MSFLDTLVKVWDDPNFQSGLSGLVSSNPQRYMENYRNIMAQREANEKIAAARKAKGVAAGKAASIVNKFNSLADSYPELSPYRDIVQANPGAAAGLIAKVQGQYNGARNGVISANVRRNANGFDSLPVPDKFGAYNYDELPGIPGIEVVRGDMPAEQAPQEGAITSGVTAPTAAPGTRLDKDGRIPNVTIAAPGSQMPQARQKHQFEGRSVQVDPNQPQTFKDYVKESGWSMDSAMNDGALYKELKAGHADSMRSSKELADERARDDRPITKASDGRKEFASQSKLFVVQRDNYDKVRISSNNTTPAGDLSLVFSYMKLLDPGSVVRESEQASASNTTGIPGRIINTYNKLVNGGSLNDAQRSEFRAMAGQLFRSAAETQNGRYKRYSYLAEKSGFSPEDVVYDLVEGRLDDELGSVSSGGVPGSASSGGAGSTQSIRLDRFDPIEIFKK